MGPPSYRDKRRANWTQFLDLRIKILEFGFKLDAWKDKSVIVNNQVKLTWLSRVLITFCYWITWKEAATDSAFDPVSSKREEKKENDFWTGWISTQNRLPNISLTNLLNSEKPKRRNNKNVKSLILFFQTCDFICLIDFSKLSKSSEYKFNISIKNAKPVTPFRQNINSNLFFFICINVNKFTSIKNLYNSRM